MLFCRFKRLAAAVRLRPGLPQQEAWESPPCTARCAVHLPSQYINVRMLYVSVVLCVWWPSIAEQTYYEWRLPHADAGDQRGATHVVVRGLCRNTIQNRSRTNKPSPKGVCVSFRFVAVRSSTAGPPGRFAPAPLPADAKDNTRILTPARKTCEIAPVQVSTPPRLLIQPLLLRDSIVTYADSPFNGAALNGT